MSVGGKEIQNAPALAGGMGAQAVVGVGGHRHGRPFEQREIVHRIGIEGHHYLFRSQIAARKPETEIVHLSLSEIGFPVDLASNVAARVPLQLGGDDVVIGKPKGLADRARNETVGGGDDRQFMAK